MRNILLSFLFLAGSASAVLGQTKLWKVDIAHSRVEFKVKYLVLSDVTGRFTDFDVTLRHQSDDFSDGMIEASIKTASINTDSEKRDRHLRSDEFLNAEKFPTLTFKSTKFEKTGNDTFKITGDLTIRDVTRTVVLDATYNGSVKDPWGNTKAGWTASTDINRFDFGVKWNTMIDTGGFVAGEKVRITLLMQFALSK